jgi:hypothetical protein
MKTLSFQVVSLCLGDCNGPLIYKCNELETCIQWFEICITSIKPFLFSVPKLCPILGTVFHPFSSVVFSLCGSSSLIDSEISLDDFKIWWDNNYTNNMRSKADVCLGIHPVNAGYEEQANTIPFLYSVSDSFWLPSSSGCVIYIPCSYLWLKAEILP